MSIHTENNSLDLQDKKDTHKTMLKRDVYILSILIAGDHFK